MANGNGDAKRISDYTQAVEDWKARDVMRRIKPPQNIPDVPSYYHEQLRKLGISEDVINANMPKPK